MRDVVAALLAIVIMAGPIGLDGEAATERLRITVSPRFGRSPAYVRVQAFVDRAAENRSLMLFIDSGDYHRSSAIEWPGEDAPRVHVAEYNSVPAGSYEVRVALIDQRGEVRAIARDFIQIFD
jgi:hypothetical protein